ncbi:MAG TPA: hypothetical protein VFS07_00440 [Gemmatimonadales bacterium]|nr:hypothetical protein [Gemmatimonadales bacterium]
MRRAFVLAGLLALGAVPAAAQSSQFGVRGLGFPNTPAGARSRAMGDAFGLFDPESGENPAALAYLTELTASFSLLNDRRTVENPAGDASLRSMRFPFFQVASAFRNVPLSVGIGASTYAARDFAVSFRDTVDVRGVPTETLDTLRASGGITDLRGAVVWRIDPRTALGGTVHLFTGVSRTDRSRYFQDSGYVSIHERAEVSASGSGFDLGLIKRLGARVTFAAVARSDGQVEIQRDSIAGSAYRVDLPISLAAGLLWRAGPRLALAAQGRFIGWSSADAALSGAGGTGARDVWQFGVGGEYLRDGERPERWPIRFGVRHAGLPFPLLAGGAPSETAVSAGTGIRFANGMAGVDLSLERVWRGEGDAFHERAWLIGLSASLRPGGRR